MVDDLRYLEQQIAIGIGGNRVGEPVFHPIECADAVLLAILELRLAADVGRDILAAQPGAFTILIHEHRCGPGSSLKAKVVLLSVIIEVALTPVRHRGAVERQRVAEAQLAAEELVIGVLQPARTAPHSIGCACALA